MSVGPLIAGAGIALFALANRGSSYWTGVLPGAVVLGIGLTITVAPLTAAVLGAIDDRHAGVGSAINNAVARLAGLLAIAILPAAAGLTGNGGGFDLAHGFDRAMYICAALCVGGGVIASLTIRRAAALKIVTRADASTPCQDPCLTDAA